MSSSRPKRDIQDAQRLERLMGNFSIDPSLKMEEEEM